MAPSPLELVTIAIIVIVIFVVGPKKIPELARAMGGAKKEFETARSELKNAASALGSPSSMLSSSAQNLPPPVSEPAAQSNAGDDLLFETAQKMGIRTQGKTREQVREEIIKVAQKGPVNSGGTPS